MRKQNEHELQKAVIKYMKLQHPSIFINGSLGGIYIKHHSQRRKGKEGGFRKGFPDLFIYEPRIVQGTIKHGLAVELKVKGNYATESQKSTLKELNQKGFEALVCTGFDQAIETIEWYINCTIPEVDVNYTIKE
tara:strand:+ start:85 stop:486 length:402 start_codon:yes stop_codon:yes gene_type:complete